MADKIVPQQSRRGFRRRTTISFLSICLVLVAITASLVALWAVLTLSLVLAVVTCTALIVVGLPICIFLAKREWNRRFPASPRN